MREIKALKLEKDCTYILKYDPKYITPQALQAFDHQCWLKYINIIPLRCEDINKVKIEKEVINKENHAINADS